MEGTQDDMTATSERIELYQGHQRHIRDPEERIAERDDVSRLLRPDERLWS